jgi:hypothetical protein
MDDYAKAAAARASGGAKPAPKRKAAKQGQAVELGGTFDAEAGTSGQARRADLRIPISFKVPPSIRSKLGEISAATGRSIAAECESRLLETFKDETTFDQVLNLLYPGRLSEVVRQILDVMRIVSSVRLAMLATKGAPADVLDNPWRYDQIVRAVNQILEAHRPAGEIKEPAPMSVTMPPIFGEPQPLTDQIQVVLRGLLDEGRNLGVRTAARRLKASKE